MEHFGDIASLGLDELREALRIERTKRLELEQDCDLLSLENVRLNSELAKLQENLKGFTLDQSGKPVASVRDEEYESLLVEGDGKFATQQQTMISSACGGKNVTCAVFLFHDSGSTHVVCGGADNSLRVYNHQTGEQRWLMMLSAPVLSMDACGVLIACSCMDGSHYVV